MIGIVTVSYNSGPVLHDFFESLDLQTIKDFTVYAIENNSTDNSLEILNKEIDIHNYKIKLYKQNENIGVAAGNNIGIKEALRDGCEYILLSNNDIILKSTAIENLAKGLAKANVNIAIPKMYYYGQDNVLWCTGGWFSARYGETPARGYREIDNGQYDAPDFVEYAPTCFMLFKKDVFKRVGLMDEKYFVYYDDSDFIWRATKNHHEKIAYIPESIIWHRVSFSTGGQKSSFYIHYFNRNKIYFTLKHFNLLQKLYCYSYLIAKYIIRDRKLPKETQKLMRSSWLEGIRLFLNK